MRYCDVSWSVLHMFGEDRAKYHELGHFTLSSTKHVEDRPGNITFTHAQKYRIFQLWPNCNNFVSLAMLIYMQRYHVHLTTIPGIYHKTTRAIIIIIKEEIKMSVLG